MNTNKTIMITGASKGLGKALTLAFAERGYSLAICARGKDQLMMIKEEAINRGAKEVVAIQADGSNERDVERFVSIAESKFGKIDVVIVNASIFGPGPTLLADYPLDDFKKVLEVNVLHPFLTIRRVLPGMLARNEGKILTITSEAGKTGFATWGAYGISKFAVEGLSQTWADELIDTGVTLNMVDPGEMDTEMHQIAVPNCDYDLIQPREITDIFLFLASEEAAHIHGQRIEAQTFKKGDWV